MSGDRIPCIVPGCRRTHKPGKFTEWICGDHWRLVPKAMKSVKNRAWRDGRKFGWTWRHRRIWDRIKREAIEQNFMGMP